MSENIKKYYQIIKNTLLQFRIKEITYKIFILVFLSYIIFKIPVQILQNNLILQLINIFVLYITINIFISLIRILINSTYKIRNKYSHDYTDTFTLGITRISTLFIVILMIPTVLSTFGLNIVEVITSMSLFGVAIAILSKDYLSNLFNGLIIMFSNNYNLKEYIKIGELKGRIINITFLSTQIKTDEGDVVLIPNTTILTEKIINMSKSNIKKITFDFTLAYDHYHLIERLEKHLSKKIIKEFKNIVESQEDILIINKEIKKDESLFVIEINVQRYSFKNENKIKKFLSKEIIKYITKRNKIN
jgi:small-conductance mechanosensitive channel